tara:strand:- start:1355 stop:2758 length:1404 start_codon:yes stop_codon:yes gene_type:complete
MLNKFVKTIHNKYYKFFRFIFFLRYLFTIFFVTITLFLIIPNFFNYEKKSKFIIDHLLDNYNYKVTRFEKIKFTSFPVPKLEIKNAIISFNSTSKNLKLKNLIVYPKLLNIYQYENFQSNKIVFTDSDISLETAELFDLLNELFKQKNKLIIKNLDINIINEDKAVIGIKNIKFKNFGYDENLIQGKIFKKNFRLKFENNFKHIDFEIKNSGISAVINLKKNEGKNIKKGILKSQILNTNLKTDFVFDEKEIQFDNFFFRNKDIVFSNQSLIIFKPFLDINSKYIIEEFNPHILEKINLNELLKSKNFIKKINSKNEINFKSKKFSNNFIDQLDLKINLAYGRVNYSKKILISDDIFECNGDINLLEDYPILFFDCNIFSYDKKKLLKKFSVKTKKKDEHFKLQVKGNLNILSKKINFKKVLLNENYNASKTDLKYFKDTFENILYDENFTKIFKLKKIKEFILEVS